MSAKTSQFTCHLSVCSAVSSSWYQRKQRSPESLAHCEGNPPVTGGFPSQRVSNAGSIYILWHHNGLCHIIVFKGFMAFIYLYHSGLLHWHCSNHMDEKSLVNWYIIWKILIIWWPVRNKTRVGSLFIATNFGHSLFMNFFSLPNLTVFQFFLANFERLCPISQWKIMLWRNISCT